MNDSLLFGCVSVSWLNHKHKKGSYLTISWKLALRRQIGAESTDLGITCRDVIAEIKEIDETTEEKSQREVNKDRASERHSKDLYWTCDYRLKNRQSGRDSPAVPLLSVALSKHLEFSVPQCPHLILKVVRCKEFNIDLAPSKCSVSCC